MATKERDNALNPEEELKKLREKTDRDELGELRRGVLGGYKSRDVASYVERLKDQLQTAEKTYKNRIAELAQEREKLRADCQELASRLAILESRESEEPPRAAEPDDAIGTEELIRRADESIAEMRGRVEALEAELAEARELNGRTLSEKDGLQLELDELQARLAAEATEHDRLLAESRRQSCELRDQFEALARANNGLADQLEISKRNILEAVSEKDALAEVNEQLRGALNALAVKADAAVQENETLNAQLADEREQSQRYRTLLESLADNLSRVRAADRMLDERVVEMDKTLNWGAGQASKPATGVHKRTKAELLDFNEGKGPAVRELVTELKKIQGGLVK
jgi:regulator of replication initiation timing